MQIEVNRNQNTYNKSINHRDLHNHPGDDEETDPPGGYGEPPHPETNGDHGQNNIFNTHHDDGPAYFGENEEDERFGDKLLPLDENTLRIGYININGLPDYNEHSKNKLLFESLSNLNPGIMGMSEINRCWRHIPHEHGWTDRTRGWWE